MNEIVCPYAEFLDAYEKFKFGDGQVPTQELVYRCLMYSFLTNEPVPRELTGLLVREMAVVRSGHDSPVFEKPKSSAGVEKTPATHPEVIYLERRAVSYVKTCRKTGWDREPVKTICDAFGITRQTYYRWEKKYPTARDDFTREGARQLIEDLAPLYQLKKTL